MLPMRASRRNNNIVLNRVCWMACTIFALLFSACHHSSDDAVNDALTLKFEFNVDGASLIQDSLGYENAAGNQYEVNEIKYFISDVQLTRSNGDVVSFAENEAVHYVDLDRPNTLSWHIHSALPIGDYTAISFVYGLSKARNVSHYFTDPPESLMSWPENLGGGYHYMQINGKWLSNETLKPFNFHTGIGQVRDSLGNVLEFVDNSFVVQLKNLNFTVSQDPTTLTLMMNVNRWFTSPVDYDFDVIGGSIMQNQEAQEMIKKNGHDVFSIK